VNAIVIGIDGGGTHTRALCADLTGHVLAYAETGGAHPGLNVSAETHVRTAISQVLAQAGREPAQVVALVAGFAGLSVLSPTERLNPDQSWAEQFTALPGLRCSRYHVNDAVVAHAGAFCTEPGVIAIAGTGSMTLGVTETGRLVHSHDFYYYTDASARSLTYRTILRLLTGEFSAADATFVQCFLKELGTEDIPDLRDKAANSGYPIRKETAHLYGSAAPLVTDAARTGIPLARAVCNDAVSNLATCIRLVGGTIEGESVPYALIGGVARSEYIMNGLEKALALKRDKRFQLLEPRLPPVAGAVLLALQWQGMAIDDELVERLRG
jgi:glucosamine kinase